MSIPPRVYGPARGQELTPREIEVQRWSATGRTDAQVGAKLGIKLQTVKNHLLAGRIKSDVTSNEEVWIALGWLTPGLDHRNGADQ